MNNRRNELALNYNNLKANLFELNLPEDIIRSIINIEDRLNNNLLKIENVELSLKTLLSLFHGRTDQSIKLEELYLLFSPYIESIEQSQKELSEILG